MLSYISTQMLCITHAPFSTLLKSCLVLRNEHYRETMDICWHLLIHRDKHIVTSAGSIFFLQYFKLIKYQIRTKILQFFKQWFSSSNFKSLK